MGFERSLEPYGISEHSVQQLSLLVFLLTSPTNNSELGLTEEAASIIFETFCDPVDLSFLCPSVYSFSEMPKINQISSRYTACAKQKTKPKQP